MSAYRLKQDGLVVASVEASDDSRARGEIDHYAAMYMLDGPVTIEQRTGGRWKPIVIAGQVRP